MNNVNFNQIVLEANDFFSNKGISITNGISDILANEVLFAEYTQRLNEGFESASKQEEVAQLFENTRNTILKESSLTGITPVTSLTMPIIRKIWAQVALTNAIPTEVLTKPRITIPFIKSYMLDAEGNKTELPEALYKNKDKYNKRVQTTKLEVTKAKLEAGILTIAAAAEVNKNVDPVSFRITGVVYNDGTSNITLPVDITTDMHAGVYGDVEVGGTKVTILGKVLFKENRMFLSLNGPAATVNKIVKLTYEVFITHEFQDKVTDTVTFEIETKDVTVGTGEHFNATVSLELLQDTMAMYNIDGALEVVDTLSTVVSQRLELEILDFLMQSYDKNPGHFNGGKSPVYYGVFDRKPAGNFSGTPTEWNEELKQVIDHLATKMRIDSRFSGGTFYIVGSRLDIKLISNIKWTMTQGQETVAGVEVEYNIGAFSSGNAYQVVASDLIEQGSLFMFYVPKNEKQMTYKYFPYSFVIDKQYRDPRHANMPSIMLTKRHTLERFTNMIAKIDIKNNIPSHNFV